VNVYVKSYCSSGARFAGLVCLLLLSGVLQTAAAALAAANTNAILFPMQDARDKL
jgi:hypothetical protein